MDVILSRCRPQAYISKVDCKLAALCILRVARGDHRDPERFEPVAFRAVALLVATSVAETLAFVLLV